MTKKNNPIPPSCRKAGVQTTTELLKEENILMDNHEEITTDTDVEKQLNRPISPTKEIPTTSDDDITPYQKPAKEPLLNGTPVPDLSDDLPDHMYEDLYGYWRSHSHYQSRVRIFEGFAADGLPHRKPRNNWQTQKINCLE